MSKHDQEPKTRSSPPAQQVKSQNPQQFDHETIAWQFRRLDWEHQHWGFNQLRAIQWRDLRESLTDLEGLRWSDIKQAFGGRGQGGGNNHHSLGVEDICGRARKRLEELRLDDYDTIFSLRLQNALRIYGIRDGRVFQLLWYDSHHDNKNAVYTTKAFVKKSSQ